METQLRTEKHTYNPLQAIKIVKEIPQKNPEDKHPKTSSSETQNNNRTTIGSPRTPPEKLYTSIHSSSTESDENNPPSPTSPNHSTEEDNRLGQESEINIHSLSTELYKNDRSLSPGTPDTSIGNEVKHIIKESEINIHSLSRQETDQTNKAPSSITEKLLGMTRADHMERVGKIADFLNKECVFNLNLFRKELKIEVKYLTITLILLSALSLASLLFAPYLSGPILLITSISIGLSRSSGEICEIIHRTEIDRLAGDITSREQIFFILGKVFLEVTGAFLLFLPLVSNLSLGYLGKIFSNLGKPNFQKKPYFDALEGIIDYTIDEGVVDNLFDIFYDFFLSKKHLDKTQIKLEKAKIKNKVISLDKIPMRGFDFLLLSQKEVEKAPKHLKPFGKTKDPKAKATNNKNPIDLPVPSQEKTKKRQKQFDKTEDPKNSLTQIPVVSRKFRTFD